MARKDLETDAEKTWCPGCGNFGILNAFKRAVEELEENGMNRKDILISSGIGCHGKIFDYLGLSGLYSIHGRSMPTVEGMKFANPDLRVVAFAGDGDAYGEGISHLIFAAKRNADITVVVHNNEAYALTTGQMSPTSEKGYKGPSTPEGSPEAPLNPLALMMEAGATYVARGYAGNISHLAELMAGAVEHEGFALIDVLQPSVVFHDTYKEYNERTEVIEGPADDFIEAMALIKEQGERIPIGLFYRKDRPIYHRELYGDWNPVTRRMSKEERRKKVEEIVSPPDD